MQKSNFFFLFLLSSLLSLSCVAQNRGQYATESKKAIKYYKSALTFLQEGRTQDALDYLDRAQKKDPNFVDVYFLKADIFARKKEEKTAVSFYNKGLEINPDYFPKAMYMAAVLEMHLMDYQSAAQHLRTYMQHPKFDRTLKSKINHDLEVCNFSLELMNHKVAFDPKNMGENINTYDDEYVNAIGLESNILIFTVRHAIQQSKGRLVEDFFLSMKDKEAWLPRKIMDKKFNTIYDEGAMALSPDGKMIVFASNRPQGYGRFDLYISYKNDGHWSIPVNMGDGVNTPYWESQPTISSDGKTIYFVSDRKGGLGGSDIYSVSLQENGRYGNPKNLGAAINTKRNEMTPFIHQDGRTLYFVSDGHLGMGGSDLFFAQLERNGKFSAAKNMGYPLNSSDNELGLIVAPDGVLSYISSDKFGGKGGFDIYNFDLYPEARPYPTTFAKGVVFDKETKKRLYAKFELIDLESQEVWISSFSDSKRGDFLLAIPTGKDFALNVYKDNYLFYSDHIHLDSLSDISKPIHFDVPLIPLKVGEEIVLKNIHFESNKYDLLPKSMVEIKKLYELLNHNPTLKVELSGHTDNIGSPEANQILSENRAKAIYNYLISRNIAANRMTYKGYGETKPIATNETEAGRLENRRTELKIVSF